MAKRFLPAFCLLGATFLLVGGVCDVSTPLDSRQQPAAQPGEDPSERNRQPQPAAVAQPGNTEPAPGAGPSGVAGSNREPTVGTGGAGGGLIEPIDGDPIDPPTDAPCPTPPTPALDQYSSMVTTPNITLSGTIPLGTFSPTIEVAGPGGTVTTRPDREGRFSLLVPLGANRINPLLVTTLNACGNRSAPLGASVIQDAEPPTLFIDFPADNAQVQASTTDVAGRIGDRLSGFDGLTLTVNGLPAAVDIGIGPNGTFFLPALPLSSSGPTPITVVARDSLGNQQTRQITVVQELIPPGSPSMAIASGNGQMAPIHTELPTPIAVRMLKGDGTPFANKVVTFDVTRSDGRLAASPGLPAEERTMLLQAFTDSDGLARAYWTLGSDAGCGNNRIEVTSRDIAGTVIFCASARPGPAAQINIGFGNNQFGETGGPLPMPLTAWVSDGCNGIEGVGVTFTVTQGGGKVDGQDSVTVPTSRTGHASVQFVLGPDAGNHVVEANFTGNATLPAAFVARGLKRDPAKPTSFTGLVFDNASQPLGGAAVRLLVNGIEVGSAATDIEGFFHFEGFAGSGKTDLFVDGLTATMLNGQPIPPNSFPGLHYEVSIVPNAENSMPMPILLPPLDPANAKAYSTTQETVLTVAGVEGLRMIVAPGSMKLPGGQPAPDGTFIALNQVHFDNIPMPMPDGAAPLFAWTLQPAGAHFDPPIRIEFPNMSGLPAGAVAFFLSFDHDTGRFEIVSSGHVTDDGSLLVSDPGSGLPFSGWGGNCPPYAVTGDVDNDQCLEERSRGNGSAIDRGSIPITYVWDQCTEQCTGPNAAGEAYLKRFAINGDVSFSVGSLAWKFAISSAVATGQVNTDSYGTEAEIDFITQANSCEVINDLADYQTKGLDGPPPARWHVSAATVAHEHYHRDIDIPGILNPLWQNAQAGIESFCIPCTESRADAAESLIANKNATHRGLFRTYQSQQTAFSVRHSRDKNDGAYAAGQMVLDQRIQEIRCHAQAQGWTNNACSLTPIGPCSPTPPGAQPATTEDEAERGAVGGSTAVVEVSCSTPLTRLDPGQQTTITVSGTSDDGTMVDLTFAAETEYITSDAQVLDVGANGQVTAVAGGAALVDVIIHRPPDGLPIVCSLAFLVTSPSDRDGDQIPNDVETRYGLNPDDESDAESDGDSDGLTAFDEYVRLADPTRADTDYDGVPDGQDPDPSLQVGPAWCLTVNGQPATPGPDHIVRFRNVSAPDQFGPGGPGTPADFLSDDAFRIVGTARLGGRTMYTRSEPFRIRTGQRALVSDVIISDRPPLLPQSIAMASGAAVLMPGQSTQLAVMATLRDGSQVDVTPRSRYTTYRSSNRNVVSINGDGLVFATGVGTAFITAVNEGATAVKRFDVASMTRDIAVAGVVHLPDGSPAVGSEVSPVGVAGGAATVGANGEFLLALTVPAGLPSLRVRATLTVGMDALAVTSDTLPIGPESNVDAGILTLSPACLHPLFAVAAEVATGSSPFSVALGDLDGDGDLDMAVANQNSSTASVLLNNGDGTFAARVDYFTGVAPVSVALGDLDGDGDLDMAVANLNGNSASVRLNNGNGTFAARVDYATGTGPISVALGDLDFDGDLDLAVANFDSNTASVLLNNGNGTFAARVDYVSGMGARSVALGDLDGDGDLDMAVVNASSNSASVLLNNGNGTFATRVDFETRGLAPVSVALGDLDGDGDLDMAVANSTSGTSGVLLNNGNGTFAARVDYTTGFGTQSVNLGDLDGDGDIDMAVANGGSGTASVLLNNGNGTLATPVNYGTGSGPLSVALGDVDGDGDLDMAVANTSSNSASVLLNNGNGTLAERVDYATGAGPQSVALGDLNGDGDLDMAVANSSSSTASVLLNNGNGTFAARVDYTTGTASLFVAIGDLDGDGDLDMTVVNGGSTVGVLLNNGNGTFATPVNYGTGPNPQSVALGDLDGDGDYDLAVTNASPISSAVGVLLNNGNGTFAASVGYGTGSNPQSVALGDLDDDGDLDMAVANRFSRTATVLLNNSNGTFATPVNYVTGLGPQSVALGDLDGDGDLDMAVANGSINTTSIFFNRCAP